MGQMKKLHQELLDGRRELHALDFDADRYDDGDWWRQQDAEMTQPDFDALEVEAEIQEARTRGYM